MVSMPPFGGKPENERFRGYAKLSLSQKVEGDEPRNCRVGKVSTQLRPLNYMRSECHKQISRGNCTITN
jgi:hypothetical protein